VAPPIVVFAPLLIVWTIVKRLDVEPHKNLLVLRVEDFLPHIPDAFFTRGPFLLPHLRPPSLAGGAFIPSIPLDRMGRLRLRRPVAVNRQNRELFCSLRPGVRFSYSRTRPGKRPPAVAFPKSAQIYNPRLLGVSTHTVCAQVCASDVMALHLAGFVMRGVSGMPLGSDAKDRESQQSTVGIVGNSSRLRVPITASEAKGEAKLSPLTVCNNNRQSKITWSE
jgi:hypothetical protein